MAIFGMNGLWAGLLYFGALAGLYGTRNAGFKDKAEMEQHWAIAARKAAAMRKGDVGAVKRAISEARSQQASTFKGTVPGFKTAEWVR